MNSADHKTSSTALLYMYVWACFTILVASANLVETIITGLHKFKVKHLFDVVNVSK